MPLHVYVTMPCGLRQGIDFDRVYAELIRPALESAGFTVFRADRGGCADEIRPEMLQELLLADLVVVDLSIDDPAVWYELGVRHALRMRGVLLVRGGCADAPFARSTDLTLHYHRQGEGPDPRHLQADREALAGLAREALQAGYGRRPSPVFSLLEGLREPHWRALLVTGPNAFRDAYEAWRRRMDAARTGRRPGDMLLLAGETPTLALRLEALREVGEALMQRGQYRFALEQAEAALALDAQDPASRRLKGRLLDCLGRHDAARALLEATPAVQAADPEGWCLLGQVALAQWETGWRRGGATPAEMRAAAGRGQALLAEAVEACLRAFIRAPGQYDAGVGACLLRHLQVHLGHPPTKGVADLHPLQGGAAWACLAALQRAPDDYRARIAWAELSVLQGDAERAASAWREAVAAVGGDRCALDCSRRRLLVLRDLGLHPAPVAAALAVLDAEIARLERDWRPRRVFLFSGHMIDAPSRSPPRFPPDKEAVAAQAIESKLTELGMGADDLAICGGACGGDILFAEAAIRRGCRVQLHLQFEEPVFLQASVAFAGKAWMERYHALREHPLTQVRIQPEELGSPPPGVDPYERNNLWQLYTALAHGPENVRFLALWNGEGGSGPGGTRHMVETVRRHAGHVSILDTRPLFGL